MTSRKMQARPFVSYGGITKMNRNKQAVRDDDVAERSEGHQVFYKIHHGLRQLPLVPGAIEERVRHPRLVG